MPLLISTLPPLREAFLDAATRIEDPPTAVIAERIGDPGKHTAQVLSACMVAAVRVAFQRWLRPTGTSPTASALVVSSGLLPELVRTSLTPLAPALKAAWDQRR